MIFIGDTRRPLTIFLAAVRSAPDRVRERRQLVLVRAAGRQREARFASRSAPDTRASFDRRSRKASCSRRLAVRPDSRSAGSERAHSSRYSRRSFYPVREFGVDPTVAAYIAAITVGAGLVLASLRRSGPTSRSVRSARKTARARARGAEA